MFIRGSLFLFFSSGQPASSGASSSHVPGEFFFCCSVATWQGVERFFQLAHSLGQRQNSGADV